MLSFFRERSIYLQLLVEFRLIVFRPFKGEIIVGRISGATENGMKSRSSVLLIVWQKTNIISKYGLTFLTILQYRNNLCFLKALCKFSLLLVVFYH